MTSSLKPTVHFADSPIENDGAKTEESDLTSKTENSPGDVKDEESDQTEQEMYKLREEYYKGKKRSHHSHGVGSHLL